MKRIIPVKRHNSSFEKNLREKQNKQKRGRTESIKVAGKLETHPVISEFSTFLKNIKSGCQ